jgi:hypothetical protein
MFQKPIIVHVGVSNPPSSTKTFKSTPTYPMSCDEKYEGYSTSKRNKTLQRQFDRNYFNLPMNSLLIFEEKWRKIANFLRPPLYTQTFSPSIR